MWGASQQNDNYRSASSTTRDDEATESGAPRSGASGLRFTFLAKPDGRIVKPHGLFCVVLRAAALDVGVNGQSSTSKQNRFGLMWMWLDQSWAGSITGGVVPLKFVAVTSFLRLGHFRRIDQTWPSKLAASRRTGHHDSGSPTPFLAPKTSTFWAFGANASARRRNAKRIMGSVRALVPLPILGLSNFLCRCCLCSVGATLPSCNAEPCCPLPHRYCTGFPVPRLLLILMPTVMLMLTLLAMLTLASVLASTVLMLFRCCTGILCLF